MASIEREYRSFSSFAAAESHSVEGYASTFETYLLYEDSEYKIYERIEPTAFVGADMSDVIFLYNHEGAVLARQKNGTLQLDVDPNGLHVRADLSKSEKARQMYEEIRAGLVDQMSFAFTVAEEEFDKKSSTRIIKRFKKLYDVSAVSIPANPNTSISARSYCDGVIAELRAERLEAEKREARKESIKKLCEVSYGD